MTVREEKAALRRLAAERIASLPPGYLDRAGAAMAGLTAALPEYAAAGTVFLFVSTDREADTRPLLTRILRDGKTLCVPLCTGPGQMQCRRIGSLDGLRPGAFGLWEPPADSPAVDPAQIGLAVVPCVACDRQGRRLGHGGGYYDRFLAAYEGPAVLLCPHALLLERVPQEPLDRPVPIVVTEKAVFRTDT